MFFDKHDFNMHDGCGIKKSPHELASGRTISLLTIHAPDDIIVAQSKAQAARRLRLSSNNSRRVT
jgi:hypothetical protein